MGRGIMRFQMQASQQQYFNSNSAFDGATVVVETLLSRNDLIAIYLRKTCLTADFTPCFIGCKVPLAVAFLRQPRRLAGDIRVRLVAARRRSVAQRDVGMVFLEEAQAPVVLEENDSPPLVVLGQPRPGGE